MRPISSVLCFRPFYIFYFWFLFLSFNCTSTKPSTLVSLVCSSLNIIFLVIYALLTYDFQRMSKTADAPCTNLYSYLKLKHLQEVSIRFWMSVRVRRNSACRSWIQHDQHTSSATTTTTSTWNRNTTHAIRTSSTRTPPSSCIRISSRRNSSRSSRSTTGITTSGRRMMTEWRLPDTRTRASSRARRASPSPTTSSNVCHHRYRHHHRHFFILFIYEWQRATSATNMS